MNSLRAIRLSFALVLLLSAPACHRSAVPLPGADAEPSVRPGINTELLKPDLDPAQWVERFEKEGREIFDERGRIVEALGLRPGMTVADIGAGTGLFAPMFSSAVGPRGKVYAVDIVKSFLQLIEERSAAAGLKNVRTVLCTGKSVELPRASIDRAFICDTYHHFEYPAATMASLHRALRSDGEVVVIDFKRVPGRSSEWVMNHVRAGQEVFVAEIEAAGFKQVEEVPLLKENYFLRFRKAGR